MKNTIIFFIIATIIGMSLGDLHQIPTDPRCGAGELSCATTTPQNVSLVQCYLPGQYDCVMDPYAQTTILAPAGTAPCNKVMYATCAYTCATDGTIRVRPDRTCPAPPSCNGTNHELPCGEACYDETKFCCINQQASLLKDCPSVTPSLCNTDSNACNFTFSGVGQLADGQLRQNYGAGAFEVSFSLVNGQLFDSRGQICYVTSPETQVQCNYQAQYPTTTSFCLSEQTLDGQQEQFLSYGGSTQFYACATGTGGFNIYTSQAVGTYCEPIFIQLEQSFCPENTNTPPPVETSTTSDSPAPSTTSETPAAPSTSSTPAEVPPTTSTPVPCTPVDLVATESCNYGEDRDIDYRCCVASGYTLQDGAFCGSTPGSQCDASSKCRLTGTVGSNCPYTVPTTSSTVDAAPTTSSTIDAAPTTSSTVDAAPTTSSTVAVPPTTSAPACTPVTFVPQTSCQFGNPARDLECCIGDGVSLSDGAFCGTQHQCAGGFCGLTGKDGENCPYTVPTTSSTVAAPKTTSSTVAAPKTTSSTVAAPKTTSSTVAAPKTTSSTVARPKTTSSTVAPPKTSAPKDTCVQKPKPKPYCYYDFDFDFEFDFKAKSTCSDRSGKGRHGSFFGGPKGCKGRKNYGAQFSGKGSQYINVPNTSDLGNTFTVATYVSLTSLSESVTIANTSTWSIQLCAKSGKIYFHGTTTVSWDVSFEVGVYFHVAVSIDEHGNTNCYKDGQKCGQTQKSSCKKHQGGFHLCKHKGSFKGSFDDLFIFDYCLTLEEINSACRHKEQDECATTPAAGHTYTYTKAVTKTVPVTKTVTKTVPAPPASTKFVCPKIGVVVRCTSDQHQVTTYDSNGCVTNKCVDNTKSKAPATTTKAAPHPPATTSSGKHNCGVPWTYFSCDKNHHSKCDDDSGHGNHGSWSGPTPSGCGGKVRNGLTFAGTTTQAITVSKCGLAKEFSIAVWVRFQVSTSGGYKIASTKASNGAAAGWELELNAATKTINFHGAGSSKASWSCSEIDTNTWFHLSLVVSGSSSECYVNGNSKGHQTVSECSAGGALWVGNSASKNGQFKGSMDEFCLFDRALNSDQVAFARDTYTNVQTGSWVSQATSDWGASWERSITTPARASRVNTWWHL